MKKPARFVLGINPRQPTAKRVIAVLGRTCLAGVLSACRSSPTTGAHAPRGHGLGAVDADGVSELFPSARGSSLRLGSDDPNRVDRLEIEKHTLATRESDALLGYWNVVSYPLDYSSGGSGKTIRLHIHASGATQKFTWKTQHGYLSSDADLKNQELTVYVRAHGIFDTRRAAVTLKVRGGIHTDRDGDLASCTMVTFGLAAAPWVSRFGKELHHPDYDYVPLAPRFTAALAENRWVGLKLVTYATPAAPNRVRYELYVDDDPFDAAGHVKNHFRLFSEYVDVEGRSTGHYSKLVDWGGNQTTVRTDGIESIDFALLSVREIEPPPE